jgi:hypothetical protein
MSEVTFTTKEFNAQAIEFRKLMGSRDFWALPSEKREIAQKALGHAYLFLEHTTPQAEIDRCAEVLTNTLTEYNRREIMLLTVGGNVGK